MSLVNRGSRMSVLPRLQQLQSTSPEDEIFYDALDYFYEEAELQSSNALTSISSVDSKSEGAVKGHPAVADGVPNVPPTQSRFSPSAAATSLGFLRGTSKPVASPTTYERPSTPPLAARAQANIASVLDTSVPKKRALLIGLNYEQCGKPGRRLYQATTDARRFATALTKLGYSSEDIRVVTDEQGQPFASHGYLIECMDWLVQDASEGDRLFFVFSGHCETPAIGKPEPYLVAADLMFIPRSTFRDRLVSKIPTGAELTIVLDCCHAAGMVQLRYCVGRMEYRPEAGETEESEALSELEQPVVPLARNIPRHKLLHSLKPVDRDAPVPLPQLKSAQVNQTSFGASVNTPSHRGCGVVVAQSPAAMALSYRVPTPSSIASFARKSVEITDSLSLATKKPSPPQVRQPVVESRPIPHFEERKVDFVHPAGKVIFWAGAGANQYAFEASDQLKGGIASNAFCTVLDTCPDSTITQRDLWHSVVGAIDKENRRRLERDSRELRKDKPSVRVQHAELWVSHILGSNYSLGPHLSTLIRKLTSLKPQSVELASALVYLHDKGIVHGDIKVVSTQQLKTESMNKSQVQDNIMISDDAHVQLGDFGSAILLNHFPLTFTQTGFKGTLRFIAPELLDARSDKHTVKSDIYALGMTILQIITGTLPFADKPDYQIPIEVVMKRSIPDRPTFYGILLGETAKDELWHLLTRCWNYEPESRPTAVEVKGV
ncbi:hypothetical protein FRC11_000870, partial [Ceratobasidium sp. 423]